MGHIYENKKERNSIKALVVQCTTSCKSGRVNESVKDPLLLLIPVNSTRRCPPPPRNSWAIFADEKLLFHCAGEALKHWYKYPTSLCKHMREPQGENSGTQAEGWESGCVKKIKLALHGETRVFTFMIFHISFLSLSPWHHWESSHFSIKRLWGKPNKNILP